MRSYGAIARRRRSGHWTADIWRCLRDCPKTKPCQIPAMPVKLNPGGAGGDAPHAYRVNRLPGRRLKSGLIRPL